jgi:hypothetical protein
MKKLAPKVLKGYQMQTIRPRPEWELAKEQHHPHQGNLLLILESLLFYVNQLLQYTPLRRSKGLPSGGVRLQMVVISVSNSSNVA